MAVRALHASSSNCLDCRSKWPLVSLSLSVFNFIYMAINFALNVINFSVAKYFFNQSLKSARWVCPFE